MQSNYMNRCSKSQQYITTSNELWCLPFVEPLTLTYELSNLINF